MRYSIRSFSMLGFLLFLSTGAACYGGDGPKALASKDTIIQAWQESGKRLHSARVAWRTVRLMSKAKFEADQKANQQFAKSPVSPVKHEVVDNDQIKIVRRTKVSIDGIRMRYETFGPDGNSETKTPIKVEAYDGKRSASLTMPSELNPFTEPSGNVYKEPFCVAQHLVDSIPIRLVMSRFVPESTPIVLADLEVSPKSMLLGETTCVLLEHTKPLRQGFPSNQETRDVIWTDPAKKFSILRHEHFYPSRNTPSLKIDFVYSTPPRGEIVPTGWTITTFDRNGKPTESRRTEVIQWESNPKFDEREFEIVFPGNARVSGL